MARKAQDFVTLEKLPDTLPGGLEVVEFEATVNVPEEKWKDKKKPETEKAIVSALVPVTGSAEGIIEYGKLYSKSQPEGDDAPDGNEFITGAIRSAVKAAVTRLVTTEDSESGKLILPPPSDIRVIDKAELAGKRMEAWTRENPGKVPTASDLKEIYSGIAG